MYPALLLPLLLGTAPGEPASKAEPVPPIQIWINNDRRFFPGDQGKVQVQTLEDGYLVVLHVDPDGHLRVVFPVDPSDDNFIRGGKKYEVHGRGGRATFDIDNRTGHGTIYAAVSKSAFRFDEFVLGDHWDYKTLAPNRLPENPENDLTDLVRRMAQGSFDYDLLGYDVIEHVYASSDYYDNPSYASVYYGSSWCCSGISLGFSFGYGYPYRYPYYYPHPYYYSAWYPYPAPYYGYYPYYGYAYYPYYGYYPYGHGHYPYHGYGGGGPYYRSRYAPRVNPLDNYRYRGFQTANGFRGVSGFQSANADYRDRRYSFRSENTVHSPTGRRAAGAEVNAPLRRTVDSRTSVADNAVDRPTTGTARRATSTEPGAQGEARRNTGSEARGNTDGEARRSSGSEARRSTGSHDHPTPSVERRRLETPGTIEARRASPGEVGRNVTPAAGDRSNWPVDVSPRRTTDASQGRQAEGVGQQTGIVARRAFSRDGYDAAGDFSPDRVAAPARSGAGDAGARRASGGDYDNRGRSGENSGGSRASGGDYDGGRRAGGGDYGGTRQGSGRDQGGGQRASGGDGGGRRSAGGSWGGSGGGGGGGGAREMGGGGGGGGGGGRRR